MKRPAHPAPFSDVIIETIASHIEPGWRVLDPFAGVGRVHEIEHARTVGIEIEPKWAKAHPDTQVGDALDLPFRANSFDAIATSPCYGNRMADSHNAQDASKRITYTHVLGQKLKKNNAGSLQWGHSYREFHRAAWREAVRVLRYSDQRDSGLFVLNVSDHIRGGVQQPVVLWHLTTLLSIGLTFVSIEDVKTPRMRRGENHDLRVEHEHVIVLRKDVNRRLRDRG